LTLARGTLPDVARRAFPLAPRRPFRVTSLFGAARVRAHGSLHHRSPRWQRGNGRHLPGRRSRDQPGRRHQAPAAHGLAERAHAICP
jgi:hypothetical protein